MADVSLLALATAIAARRPHVSRNAQGTKTLHIPGEGKVSVGDRITVAGRDGEYLVADVEPHTVSVRPANG